MASMRSIIDEFRMTARFLTTLPGFLRHADTEADGRRRIETQLRGRGKSFLRLVERGIYSNDRSPYRRLLEHAGIAYPDVVRLVGSDGVEGALTRLHDAGVYVTLDEFKGRRPIRRGSLDLPVAARDFDNPDMTAHFATRTGGSRSAGSRLTVDLAVLSHESCYDPHTLEAFGLVDRPKAMWRPVPPGSAGLKISLRHLRIGHPMERWFSQNPVFALREWRHALFTSATVAVSRLAGRRLAMPEYVPLAEASTVARWLADHTTRGRPALLDTNAASAVRVCMAAKDHGWDIAGTFFRVGGEPFSPGKARIFDEAGCQAACHYSMAEVGRIAMACGDRSALDEMHVALDKVALLQRDVRVSGTDTHVPGLFLTTLMANTPKVMLNVELGDYGVMSNRRCGCAWQTLGFTQHLHTIRSYEKLTSEGMHFVGAELVALVDEILPARFGGAPIDYQFVEQEEDGLPRVSLVVSLRVGPLDDGAVSAVVLAALGGGGAAHRMMTDRWLEGGTLRIVRREPYSTFAGKIQTLHVPQP